MTLVVGGCQTLNNYVLIAPIVYDQVDQKILFDVRVLTTSKIFTMGCNLRQTSLIPFSQIFPD